MYDRTGNYLIVAILIGMILGVIAVVIFGPAAISVKFLGDMFVNALKMIVIPLVFLSLVVGIAALGDIRKLGRIGLKTLGYFLATSAIAAVIGLVLVNVAGPGSGYPVPPSLEPVGDKAVAKGERLEFAVSATDGNKTTPVLSTSALPSNASFAAQSAAGKPGTVAGRFIFAPDSTQVGTYYITFYAFDADKSAARADSALIAVTVTNDRLSAETIMANASEEPPAGESYSFFTWLTEQIPENVVAAAAQTRVLPVILFALLFGGILATMGAKGKPLIALFEGLNEAIMKIVRLIMWFAPLGVFGLVAGALAANGGVGQFATTFSALGRYVLVVLIGLLLHAVVVLPLILKFIAGKNPLEYFVGMSQALMTAFATSSSAATLPVTMECVEEKNDVDKRSSSFVLPLGTTLNMDGTTLYEAVAALFIAQAYGISMPIWTQAAVLALAVLASIGASGIPQAGMVTLIVVLQTFGLPLEGVGLILAIDWFLDRCRTTVNVWSNSIGAAVIATTAEIGLVDRRRLRELKRFQVDRPRPFGRRDDSFGKRKGPEQPAVKGREASPARPAGSDTRQRDESRPGGRPPRRGDRSDRGDRGDRGDHGDRGERRDRGDRRDRRPFARDSRGEGGPPKDRPEPYRPRREAPVELPAEPPSEVIRKPKPVEPPSTPPVPKAPVIEAESDVEAQPRTRFGRKRTRPSFIRQKTQAEAKEQAEPETPEMTPEEKTDGKVAYEVPKFPESVLDQLAVPAPLAGTGEPEDAVETPPKWDEGSGAEEEDEDTPFDDIADDVAVGPERPRFEASAPEEDDHGEEEDESSADFTRLDEAILGRPDGIDTEEDDSSTDDFMMPEEVESPAGDVAGSESDTERRSADRADEDRLPIDAESETEEEAAPPGGVEETRADDTETSADEAEESPREDNSDGDDAGKWGRRRHRRPSK